MFVTLALFFLFWLLGYVMTLGRIKDIDETVYQELKRKDRETYISFIDGLKPKSKEDKIKELKEEIAELEKE